MGDKIQVSMAGHYKETYVRNYLTVSNSSPTAEGHSEDFPACSLSCPSSK